MATLEKIDDSLELTRAIPSQSADQTAGGFQQRSEIVTDDFSAWLVRELHDGVTQELWYLQAELSSLSQRLHDAHTDLISDISRLRGVAQNAYQEIRSTLDMLNTRGASKVALAAELRCVMDRFVRNLGMQIDLHISCDPSDLDVTGEVGRQVSRLVQEAVWNSWRHSMSTQAKVSAGKSKAGLVITVSDNGCGFNLDEVDESHYGLRNMRERAQLIGGNLYVTSDKGQGTIITLQFPKTDPNSVFEKREV